jgi:nitrite reductase/ring-hydroxylating ferredoxin subunit
VRLLKTLIFGRENGIRAKLRTILFGGSREFSDDTGSDAPLPDPMGGVMAGGATKMEPPKDVTPPDGYEVVLHKDALIPGEVTEVIIGGTAIAVCNVSGSYLAMSNVCPLDGSCPLGEGELVGDMLRCSYHGWTFDPVSGQSQTNPEVTIPVYSVVMEGDAVCVKL